MNIKWFITLPVTFFTYSACCLAQAPDITLAMTEGSSPREILFQIDLSSTPSGCDFGLWAAPSMRTIKKVPDKSRLIATFGTTLTRVNLIAQRIPPVQRSRLARRKRRAFFQFLLVCGDDISSSNIVRYRVPVTSKRAVRSVKHWILKIKALIDYA